MHDCGLGVKHLLIHIVAANNVHSSSLSLAAI